MPYDEPVTPWIRGLAESKDENYHKLWQAYFSKLVSLARSKMVGRKQLVDEEDVALSAFKSFCAGVEADRFPQLDNRNDLWRILVSITLRKAAKAIRDSNRQKRGGGWKQLQADSEADIVTQLADEGPTPEMAAEFAEQFRLLMDRLASPELVELASLKMEGFTNAEIAQKWNKAQRTVERKLAIVRKIWEEYE